MRTILRALSAFAAVLIAIAGLRLWNGNSRSSSFATAVHKPVSDVRFDGSFADVAVQFEGQTGIHVVLTNAAIQDLRSPLIDGIHYSERTPRRIHAQLHDADPFEALQDVASRFSSDLAVRQSNGCLEIVTRQTPPLELRVYDLGDLARTSRELNLGNESSRNAAAPTVDDATVAGMVSALSNQHNARRAWWDCQIQLNAVGDNVLVLETPQGHRQFAELLLRLRQANIDQEEDRP